MKKLLLTIKLILFLCLSSNAQHIGGGINMGSETLFGANLTYIHSLEDKFSFNVDALWFLPHTTNKVYVDYVVKRFELNGNYQYNYNLLGINVYPYAGLNISHIVTDKNLTTTSDQRLNTSESEFEIGLNIGVGVIIPLQKQFDVFVDGRYTFHDYDQLLIKGGLLFNL